MSVIMPYQARCYGISALRLQCIRADIHCESKKNCATFIFTVTLANVGRFLKFFQYLNQKENGS